MHEVKKVGPNLKEVRMKLNKEWIPVWLKNPHEWRPGTKMPTFRLTTIEIQAISAFVWQSGVTGRPAPPEPRQRRARQGALRDARLHGLPLDGRRRRSQGGTFAANLSRVGEKDNYDYLVRWIHNPRERTRPTAPSRRRTWARRLRQEESALRLRPRPHQVPQRRARTAGAADDGDAEPAPHAWTTRGHRQLPADPKARTLRYADASFMDDPKLKDKARSWMQHYGCAGCHEISGMEDEAASAPN